MRDAARRAADAAAASVLPGGAGLAPVLARVDGYLYPHEGVFLYWLARSVPCDGTAVEVGSNRGRSTLCLAKGLLARRAGRLFAVDPHVYGTEQELRENLAHFNASGVVVVEVAPSLSVAAGWSEPIRLIFIDGDHSAEAVEADLRFWLPHLVPGGFLLLHDSTELSKYPGPKAVARRRIRRGETFDLVGSIGSITWGRRSGGESPWTPPQHGRWLDGLLRRYKGVR